MTETSTLKKIFWVILHPLKPFLAYGYACLPVINFAFLIIALRDKITPFFGLDYTLNGSIKLMLATAFVVFLSFFFFKWVNDGLNDATEGKST